MDAKYELTPKQDIAFRFLMDEKDRDLLYGGAKGGGKSFLLCLWVYVWAKHLAELFGIKKPQRNPLPVGFMGRKRSADFAKTTFETWKKVIPWQCYTEKKQAKELIIEEKVKVFFGGLDDQENIEKFNSAELAFIAIDQAEETERVDIGALEGSLRLKHNGIQPPYKTLFTANPAECWLKDDFVRKGRKSAIFVPALPYDNPHLPQNYIPQLEKSFAYDEVLLRAYRDGDWEALQPSNTLISSSMLDVLEGLNINEGEVKRLISIDPSLGGDECVMYAWENTRIIDKKYLHERDTMKIVAEAILMGERNNIQNFAVDVIGIGIGIANRLRELRKRVMFINSAEEAEEKDRFLNCRAEMWFYASEKIRNREVWYPEDEELRRQLVQSRYIIVDSTGKIKIEPKNDIIKRLKRSPDRADAYIMGLWGLKEIDEHSQYDEEYQQCSAGNYMSA